MKLGSVPLRPLWPGSMPTVIPASGLAAAAGSGLGFGVAGSDARTAAGDATVSPADLVPLAAGCGLPHAASKQARTAGQAAASSCPRLARRAGLPVACGPWPQGLGRAGWGEHSASPGASPRTVRPGNPWHAIAPGRPASRPHRACPVPVTVWLGLLGAYQPLNVSMFSIFHRPPSRRAVTANIAPA
jgi:hypothetical protein